MGSTSDTLGVWSMDNTSDIWGYGIWVIHQTFGGVWSVGNTSDVLGIWSMGYTSDILGVWIVGNTSDVFRGIECG